MFHEVAVSRDFHRCGACIPSCAIRIGSMSPFMIQLAEYIGLICMNTHVYIILSLLIILHSSCTPSFSALSHSSEVGAVSEKFLPDEAGAQFSNLWPGSQ